MLSVLTVMYTRLFLARIVTITVIVITAITFVFVTIVIMIYHCRIITVIIASAVITHSTFIIYTP